MTTPLYVDLDGTLLRGDSLHEACLSLVIRPSSWPAAMRALFAGKAAFKQVVVERSELRAEALPYRPEFLTWLREQRNAGRRLILATGADRAIADSVANHLGIFDEVLASDGRTNLTGAHKLKAIQAHAAGAPFAYAGDGSVDLPIWAAAHSAVLVGAGLHHEQGIGSHKVEARFPDSVNSAASVLRALRPYQWAKNVLVFLPAAAAHRLLDPVVLRADLLLFGAFSLCASGVYAANDLLDLESDRGHAEKRRRPLAAGSVTIPVGVAIAGMLPLLALVMAFAGAGWPGVAMIAGYWLATSYYSLHGKRVPLLDVFLLAGLYTFRAYAGALVIPAGLSAWMVAFLLFLFLGLACLKRFSELLALPEEHQGSVLGRGYRRTDHLLVAMLGVGAGFAATLVVCLYAAAPAAALLYAQPMAVMGIAPIVLFGLSRLWLQAWRSELHSDPVLHALRDRVSYLLIGLCVLWALAASWL
jgi:4-hydroxybenzoate polyprenyltransferase/phosphoserine phosphatase